MIEESQTPQEIAPSFDLALARNEITHTPWATLDPERYLVVEGARAHNLKNISVVIPRDILTVITGLSGSGKSSLAFDVIYAEGQRRYMETLNAYARQFLGGLERPDVDFVSGLAPVVAIEQRTTARNARSTVGTITEIYDFLRLLYARVATAFSPVTGLPLTKHTDAQILDLLYRDFKEKTIALCAPVVRGRKGHYEKLFVDLTAKGYLHARIDGAIEEIKPKMRLDRYSIHDVEIVIDRVQVTPNKRERLAKSLKEAFLHGKHDMVTAVDLESGKVKNYSRSLICPESGFALETPEPYSFSFNSEYGQCPRCQGTGEILGITRKQLIADPTKGLFDGALKEFISHRTHQQMLMQVLGRGCEQLGINKKTPYQDIDPDLRERLIWGDGDETELDLVTVYRRNLPFPGLLVLLNHYLIHKQNRMSDEEEGMLGEQVCPFCHGTRLKPESLCFKIEGMNIAESSALPLDQFARWTENLEQHLEGAKRIVAIEILKEIRSRVSFLLGVGLDYLSLARRADSLSGGESQRIRLATQIGTNLVNVLYIFDEPSIGLHPRDNDRLIDALKKLRDQGNTIIVVEHDEELMRAADWIVDMGPRAGRHGGEIMASGSLEDVLKTDSLTAAYLSGSREIEVPKTRRKGNGKSITIHGARGNNLKDVTARFPLGTFICVTGVSGSGKSSLVNETLQPILSQHLYRSLKDPLPYSQIEGIENVDKVIQVDQSPLGRTPRSNPATYTTIFTDIRKLFAATPAAKMRGYKMGRFSFNVKGGRCENCRGAGVEQIEMNFLPNVHVKCTHCNGERYNRETLSVRYKGQNISQVLDMTINQASEFFDQVPTLARKLQALQSVGMGYVKLGQPCTTLSGGESQRIRLAAELGKKSSGNTLYILDEPTTGLHFEDIRMLLKVINELTDQGNTVIVIEHNLDMIKAADWVIDIGPESGERGGIIVAEGTPEEVAQRGEGHTAHYLRKTLNIL